MPELTPERLSEIVEEFAQAHLEYEINWVKQHKPDKVSLITPESKERCLEGARSQGRKIVDSLLTRESTCIAWSNGQFGCQNPRSRKIFTAVTGVVLPAGEQSTDKTIRAYLGEDFVAAREAGILAIKQAKEQEVEAKKAAAIAEQDASVDGFTEGMTPIQRARILATLNVKMRFDDVIMTRLEMIRTRVAAGAVVDRGSGNEGRRLYSSAEKRSYVPEKEITKTAVDYAVFLITKRDSAK